LRSLLAFPEEPTSALDPCAGTGVALQALTADSKARLYAVELDALRAAAAKAAGIATIQGNIVDVKGRVERLGLLYLNPPYDSEVGPTGSQRMEQTFLSHTYAWLRPKGVLLMVIPHKVIYNVLDILASRFRDLRVYRMVGEECEKYDQIAVFGVRHNNTGRDTEAHRAQLLRRLRFPSECPVLADDLDACYIVPPSEEAVLTYSGVPLDEVEDRLASSSVWKYACPLLLPRQEVAGGQPLTPLHGGHVGLLATSGMLNGTFGDGQKRHIARWRPVKHTTTTTEVEGDVAITRTRERFSNELALVFITGETMILTETKNQEEGSETGETVVPKSSMEGVDVVRSLPKGLFELGRQVASRAVHELVAEGRINIVPLLARHARGDWGEMSALDRQSNDDAISDEANDCGDRIFSSYHVPGSPEGKIWIITERDRSVTTVLLPSDY